MNLLLGVPAARSGRPPSADIQASTARAERNHPARVTNTACMPPRSPAALRALGHSLPRGLSPGGAAARAPVRAAAVAMAAARPPRKRVDGITAALKAAAMTSRISHTSLDALDAYAQSVFWSQVLDFIEDPDDPNEPGHEECLIMSRDRSQLLLFITVPDGKLVKNRVHLDLRPADRTREQETERLLSLGASHLADHRRPDGSGWITLADPEGNEFCILSREPARSGATTRNRCAVTPDGYRAAWGGAPAPRAAREPRIIRRAGPG